MPNSIITRLDKIANTLEARGLSKYATSVDEVSNLLEEAQSTTELIDSKLHETPIASPLFADIDKLLKDQVHNNPDSVILKKLRVFHVSSKGSSLGLVKKIKAILSTGTQLHPQDIAFLHSVLELFQDF